MKGRAAIGLLSFVLLFAGIMPSSGFAEGAGNMPVSGDMEGGLPGDRGEIVTQVITEPQEAAAADAGALEAGVTVPVLDPMPSPTRENFVEIKGGADPGASVTIWYSLDGGEERQAGEPTIAHDDGSGKGRFALNLELEGEGTYRFTAAANVDGQVSGRSETALVKVDLTDAGDVTHVAWEMLAYNRILLNWEPPYLETGEPNPDVEKYRVYTIDYELLTETADTSFVLEELEESKLYIYRITTVDRSGNESAGELVNVGTSPKSETKLTDLIGESEDIGSVLTALSGDGSTAVFTDITVRGSGERGLYAIDIATKEKESVTVTKDGAPPNGSVRDPKISRTGKVIVFASNASNLTVSPATGGDHVYAYDRDSKTLALVSSPDFWAAEPSVSGDGRRIVFTENDRIYVYDRASGSRKLVSEASDGTENGRSYGPAISGNGGVIAFLSESANLKDAPAEDDTGQAIYVYDTAEEKIVGRFVFNDYHGSLAVNEDGRYIAYTEGGGADWPHLPYYFDRTTGETYDLNNGRSETEMTDKTYDRLTISGSVNKVLANLVDSDPQVLYMEHYMELFDVVGEQVITAGNPALNAYAGAMDGAGNRIIYARDGALYTYCLKECGQTGPEQPIGSGYWSVPASSWLGSQLKRGSGVTIQANGEKGLSVQAVVTYKQAVASEDSPSSTETKVMTVQLPESGDAAGLYRGQFEPALDTAEITSIVLQLADGSSTVALDQLPVQVAGELSVDIESTQTGLPDGSYLAVTGPVPGGETQLSIVPGVNHYDIPLQSGGPYAIKLRNDQANVTLAEQSGIVIRNGAAAAVTLKPVFTAALTVNVNYTGHPSEPAVVVFKAEDGSELAKLAADEHGEARLPGTYEVGESITVSVTPPPGYKAGPARTIELQLGVNELSFELFETSTSVASVTMNYSRTVGQGGSTVPVMGSDAVIAAAAKPGLHLEAFVSYLEWKGGTAPEAAEKKIALSEAEPGKYSGVFKIEDGMARIDAVYAEVDGERLANRFAIEKNIAGRLKVSFDIPEGEVWSNALDKAEVAVFYFNDIYKRHYALQNVSPGKLDYSFDVPYTDIPYRVTVAPWSSALAPVQADAPVFGFGQTGELKVKPKYMVQMKGIAKAENGQKVGVSYSLTDSGDNVVLRGSAYGDIDLRLTADYGGKYRLHIEPADPLYYSKTIDLTVDALSKEIPIVLQSKPLHELTGKVIGLGGLPISGATVTTIMDGKERTFQAASKTDGTYSLQLPAGTAKVRAVSYGKMGFESRLHLVNIPEQGGAEADLTLLDFATVDFNLYTKQLGSDWQGPVTWDWRVAYHFGLKTSHGIMQYGPPMKVAAVAGDTFRICVDGYQADLPSACKEITIGEDNRAAVEIRLESTGAQAKASFAKPDGSDAGNVYPAMFQLEGEEAVYRNVKYTRSGNEYVFELPSNGRYRLTAKGENGLQSAVEFTADAFPLDLGRITMQAPGKFSGAAGNGIGTSSDLIAPGGKVTARVSYNNSGYPAKGVTDAAILLELPKDMDPMAGSLIVNGQAKEIEQRDGSLYIPVGDIKAYQAGGVTLGLRIGDPGLTAGNLPITARIRYSSDGAQREETIGTAFVQVAKVTLRVPETIVQPQFRVSGTAPAGSEVTVYDGSDMLGTAKASPEGTWQSDIELKDTETLRHSIRTEALAGDNRVAGEEAVLVYDINDPGLAEVSMRQGDGRVQVFHPDNGVAVFPFVYVPGQPFVYKLKFRDASRISDVQVWNGGTFAEAKLVNGEYVAAMTLPNDPGPIAVTYRKKADPHYIPPRPTEKELRSTLPEALRNFEIESVTLPEEGLQEGQSGKTLSMNIRLNESYTAKISFTSTPSAGYTPTDRDLQLEQLSGIPLYGSSLQHSESAKGATASFSAYYSNRSELSRAAIFSPENIKIVVDMLSTGTKIYDTNEALNSLLTPNTSDRITADLEAARAICDPRAAEYYTDMAEEIRMDIMFSELLKNAINYVGSTLFEGPQGLLFWAEGTWAGKELDAVVDRELTELESYLKQYDCKVKPYPKPPKKPAATPKYIFDPSGYVYEGLPGNRLEDVTATVMELESATGTWGVWDAEWYEQQNPQSTDAAGRYGWDVPAGKWKVKFEKDGYETAYSNELDVPPPQLDVNVPMKSYAPPKVSFIRAYPAGAKVGIRFTKPIVADTADADSIVITDADGKTVQGEVKAVDPAPGLNGSQLAMAVEFVPETPLAAGGTYTVKVSGRIVGYAGVPLGQETSESITIEAADRTPPGDVAELTGGLSADTASFLWSSPNDPDFAGTRIRWKKSGTDAYGDPIDIGKGQEWAGVNALDAAEAYDFLISAVDESGNESAGVRWSWPGGERRIDLAAPPSVSDVKIASVGKDRIGLVWTDPSAPDLSELEISWYPANDETKMQTIKVAKGIQTAAITGLQPSTKYVIHVAAVDNSGNESAAAAVIGETSADSDGGNPGGGGKPDDSGSGQTGNGAWTIGADGGSFEAFDGKLKLDVKKGTFAPDTKLAYAVVPPDSGAGMPAGYSRMSPTYLMDGGSANTGKPMLLDIAYDPNSEVAKKGDIRRLGIYVKDSSSRTGWTYVGGVTDAKNHRVSVKVKAFGEYAILLYERSFADMATHWSRPDIDVLVSRHLLDGVAADRFDPDRPITRAEIIKLLVTALQQSGAKDEKDAASAADTAFADVPRGAWFAPYVKLAAGFGLVQGADGRFRPNDPVTREELVVLFARYAQLQAYSLPNAADTSALEPFEDARQLSVWARGAFAQAASLGWIRGITETSAKPKGIATRAQSAVMLLRVMDTLGQVSAHR